MGGRAVGPAGLSVAIRLKQLAQEKGVEIGVCVLDKSSEIGDSVLVGRIRALLNNSTMS
jgi:electron-transferring-flavoprotein dehydrogenase